MKWSVTVASNNQAVLQQNLLRSPDLQGADIHVRVGYSSVALAFNPVLESSAADIVIFVHQDIYLPSGWIERLLSVIKNLQDKDPRWAVLGVYGISAADGEARGHVYCTGNRRTLGRPFEGVVPVQSLDEIVLVVRRESGLRFDQALGYHLYGTDICLTARKMGWSTYAASIFCLHNSNGYKYLPLSFWQGYRFLQRKWRAELPVRTPCTVVRKGITVPIESTLRSFVEVIRGHRPGERVDDPQELLRSIGAA